MVTRGRKPAPSSTPTLGKAAKRRLAARTRVAIDVSEALHRKIKVHAAIEGLTMSDYVVELLRRAGMSED